MNPQGQQNTTPGDGIALRATQDLRPHPGFIRHGVLPSAREISRVAARGETALQEPIIITPDNWILEGYAVWQLARQRQVMSMSCIVRQLTEEEALLQIIANTNRRESLGDYLRIMLALDLEGWFQSKARHNQRRGGAEKGSSNLTEANRVDVRSEIALAAGVSTGNVSKVKYLQQRGVPEVLEALRNREISIDRAYRWVRLGPERQAEQLTSHRRQRSIMPVIRKLLRRHAKSEEASNEQVRALCGAAKSLLKDDRFVECSHLIAQLLNHISKLAENG